MLPFDRGVYDGLGVRGKLLDPLEHSLSIYNAVFVRSVLNYKHFGQTLVLKNI